MAGYTLKEVIGKDFRDFVAPEDLEMVANRYHRRQAGENIPKEYEFRVLQKDGITRSTVNMNVGLINYRGRVASMGTLKDITERKQVEEQIRQSLKEKEILLREIHHRVKNNMQIVSSLLRLQSGYIKDEKYREMFRDSQNRIMTMSLVHEKLYQSKNFAKIDIKDYIRDLVICLFQNHGVTNSLKYAFPDGRKGEIDIVLRKDAEDEIKLIVSDNGIGIPEGVDFRKTESLGLYLVRILAEDQLHGVIDVNRSKGTEFKIKFKGVKKNKPY